MKKKRWISYLMMTETARKRIKARFGLFHWTSRLFHANHHAGAAPAQIGMKTGAAELPVFWYNTLERGTLQSTVGGVARNSSAAKAVC